MTLTLLVAVCGGVHVKPIVYIIHEETDGMVLPPVSAIELAVRDVALNESTDLKWLPIPQVPVLTCSYTQFARKIAAIMKNLIRVKFKLSSVVKALHSAGKLNSSIIPFLCLAGWRSSVTRDMVL